MAAEPNTFAGDFVESRVRAIYAATTPYDFNAAVDSLVLEDAKVIVNGAHLTREAYKKLLERQRPLEREGTVKFTKIVELVNDSRTRKLPEGKSESIIKAPIGIFFDVYVDQPHVPEEYGFYGIMRKTIHSSMNILVERKTVASKPPHLGMWQETAAKRISQVITENSALLPPEQEPIVDGLQEALDEEMGILREVREVRAEEEGLEQLRQRNVAEKSLRWLRERKQAGDGLRALRVEQAEEDALRRIREGESEGVLRTQAEEDRIRRELERQAEERLRELQRKQAEDEELRRERERQQAEEERVREILLREVREAEEQNLGRKLEREAEEVALREEQLEGDRLRREGDKQAAEIQRILRQVKAEEGDLRRALESEAEEERLRELCQREMREVNEAKLRALRERQAELERILEKAREEMHASGTLRQAITANGSLPNGDSGFMRKRCCNCGYEDTAELVALKKGKEGRVAWA